MSRAAEVARVLGGASPTGNGWSAQCPVAGHGKGRGDQHPSLSISDGPDGKILVCCHAGCPNDAVITALRHRGLWTGNHHRRRFIDPERRRAGNNERALDDAKRTEAALRIWRVTTPASGTPIETYLEARGITLPVPDTLRFHAGLKHPTGEIWTTMVALVTRGPDDAPLAIHRTFLARDGSGKAPVDPQKMMLGPCRGGAVRLGMSGDVLMVGEGIETCLAAMQATGNTTWAALSIPGMHTLELPAEVTEVIVLADGDDPGEAAARETALRLRRDGRTVRIARPPRGLDFNDLLLGRAPLIEEDAA